MSETVSDNVICVFLKIFSKSSNTSDTTDTTDTTDTNNISKTRKTCYTRIA